MKPKYSDGLTRFFRYLVEAADPTAWPKDLTRMLAGGAWIEGFEAPGTGSDLVAALLLAASEQVHGRSLAPPLPSGLGEISPDPAHFPTSRICFGPLPFAVTVTLDSDPSGGKADRWVGYDEVASMLDVITAVANSDPGRVAPSSGPRQPSKKVMVISGLVIHRTQEGTSLARELRFSGQVSYIAVSELPACNLTDERLDLGAVEPSIGAPGVLLVEATSHPVDLADLLFRNEVREFAGAGYEPQALIDAVERGDQGRRAYIAKWKGATIGFVVFTAEDEGCARMCFMIAKTEYRNRGLAKDLFRSSLRRARDLGFVSVHGKTPGRCLMASTIREDGGVVKECDTGAEWSLDFQASNI